MCLLVLPFLLLGLYHILRLVFTGKNLVPESKSQGEEGEQEENAAANTAGQYNHSYPTCCCHTWSNWRHLQQYYQPGLLITNDYQGRIHALSSALLFDPQINLRRNVWINQENQTGWQTLETNVMN